MPTYFIGLNILLTRQGGDFFIIRIIAFYSVFYIQGALERGLCVTVKG